MNYEARGKFREHAQRCVRCARVTFYFSFQMRQLFGQFGLQLGHCEGTGKKINSKKIGDQVYARHFFIIVTGNNLSHYMCKYENS